MDNSILSQIPGLQDQSASNTDSLSGLSNAINNVANPFNANQQSGQSTQSSAVPAGSNSQQYSLFGIPLLPAYASAPYNDPSLIANAYFSQPGMNPYAGGYGAAQAFAEALPTQSLFMQGLGSVGQGYLNYAGNQMQQAMTPGGGVLSAGTFWDQIFTTDKSAPAYQLLHNQTPGQEASVVTNTLSAIHYGLETSTPAPVLNALMSRVNFLGQSWMTGHMTGQISVDFPTYMAQNGLGPGALGS